MALYKGVQSAYLPYGVDGTALLDEAVAYVKNSMNLNAGDHIAITLGDVVGVDGHTNTLKILKVA